MEYVRDTPFGMPISVQTHRSNSDQFKKWLPPHKESRKPNSLYSKNLMTKQSLINQHFRIDKWNTKNRAWKTAKNHSNIVKFENDIQCLFTHNSWVVKYCLSCFAFVDHPSDCTVYLFWLVKRGLFLIFSNFSFWGTKFLSNGKNLCKSYSQFLLLTLTKPILVWHWCYWKQ